MDRSVASLGALPVGNGAVFESATITCSHCQRVIVLNPDRSRSRGYCPKCDHYICDECEAVRAKTLACVTFEQIIDQVQEAGVAGRVISPSSLLVTQP